jgi:hypothetical protein
LWIPSYVIEKGKMGRVLEITGSPHNVKIAAYVFDVVRAYIDSQWKKYNKNKNLTLHRKTDFAVGVVRGFYDKLASRQSLKSKSENFQETSKALAKLEDPRLEDYFSYRYPRVIKSSRGTVNQDYEVFADGKKSGKKLVISKGVTETGESGKLLA